MLSTICSKRIFRDWFGHIILRLECQVNTGVVRNRPWSAGGGRFCVRHADGCGERWRGLMQGFTARLRRAPRGNALALFPAPLLRSPQKRFISSAHFLNNDRLAIGVCKQKPIETIFALPQTGGCRLKHKATAYPRISGMPSLMCAFLSRAYCAVKCTVNFLGPQVKTTSVRPGESAFNSISALSGITKL